MTSLVNYAIIIALAIILAAGASLVYVIYSHSATTQTATAPPIIPTPTSTPTPTNATSKPAATTTQSQASSRVIYAAVYIATPEVLQCANLGKKYYYYFNITVERTRPEDPVTHYVFKAVTANGTLQLNTASILSLERDYFKQYDLNATRRLGVVNIYLELESDKPLDVKAVNYLGVNYTINKYVYIACIGKIWLRGDINLNLTRPGTLGLVPADRTFTLVVKNLPNGRYKITAPPDVVIPSDVVINNNTLSIPVGLINKPLVYNPLILELKKAQ